MDDLKRPLVCCALASAFIGGCATQTQPRDDAPSAALEDLGNPTSRATEAAPSNRGELADSTRRFADDMASLMKQLEEKEGARPAVEQDGIERPWQNREAEQETPPPEVGGEKPVEQAPAPKTEAVADETPAPDPIALVLERLETDEQDPERALAAALLAQAIREYASADDGSRPGQNLSPPERELAELLGPLLDAMATGDRADAPSRIGVAIDEANRKLASVLPVRINDAALATDIYGFAAYKPFETYKFLAGRTTRMLVYTEPANFQSRLTAEPASQGSASNPGAYEVALGIELQLYNERGSMLAWRRQEERVSIRSDRPRTEIYLGTMIDLPDRLTVGRYQLKVVLRDHADGSEDERVIPIEIVADPRLTTRSTRTP